MRELCMRKIGLLNNKALCYQLRVSISSKTQNAARIFLLYEKIDSPYH